MARRLASDRLAADGASLAAIGESESEPQDLWLLPVPGVAAEGSRGAPDHELDAGGACRRLHPGRTIRASGSRSRPATGSGSRAPLWRPTDATGKRGARRVPTILFPHGGPAWQAYRGWVPFKQLLVREGFAFLDVDFRGSTGYGRAFRSANQGEWGHADAFDMIDAGHWAAGQPWSDGRLAIYGGSYGGYLVLCALVEEPGLWRAGVDLFGDSEIAESFRHGDRAGRLDIARRWAPRTTRRGPRSIAAARPSTGPNGSRRRC